MELKLFGTWAKAYSRKRKHLVCPTMSSLGLPWRWRCQRRNFSFDWCICCTHCLTLCTQRQRESFVPPWGRTVSTRYRLWRSKPKVANDDVEFYLAVRENESYINQNHQKWIKLVFQCCSKGSSMFWGPEALAAHDIKESREELLQRFYLPKRQQNETGWRLWRQQDCRWLYDFEDMERLSALTIYCHLLSHNLRVSLKRLTPITLSTSILFGFFVKRIYSGKIGGNCETEGSISPNRFEG